MNKIYIHKGDCTIFGNCKKFLTFMVSTHLDLTGWTAEFVLGAITKQIGDITSKSFEVILSAKDTNQLLYGEQYGSVILTDDEGNIKTIINTIPFEVTSKVIENEYQEIDLTIPETSGVDIALKVGSGYVTPEELEEKLETKQDKGDYALKSEIPDISGLATKEEIPDTSNLATKDEIPNISNLATKDDIPDVSNLATRDEIPSLDGYVKNTDFATSDTAGVVKVNSAVATVINANGIFYASTRRLDQYKSDSTTNPNAFISKGTLENIKDDYVKRGLTENDIELTADEKASARTWIGAIGDADYATATKAGILTPSGYYGTDMSGQYLYTQTKTLDQYKEGVNGMFVGKGTLENVLTQYSKTVLTTEADYEALATKDANTLYLIEE